MGEPAIFLDKDGTLVENVPYNVEPDLIRLSPGALSGLEMLRRAGFKLVVVTNQSGIARGYFSEDALESVKEKLQSLLGQAGVLLDGFYACPHLPEGSVPRYAVACACRKPAPGLYLRAAQELGIALPDSWAIGDILDDVEAGWRAGCRTVLIDNGHETEWEPGPRRLPDHTVADLEQAARAILGETVRDVPCVAQSAAGGGS